MFLRLYMETSPLEYMPEQILDIEFVAHRSWVSEITHDLGIQLVRA
jgi:hypothetical protein